MADLVDSNTYISEESMQLMKFHGSYMQDDRDKRNLGRGKKYQFMMRTRQPGGEVSNELYLTMDELADQFGNGTLRLTTRMAFQLHGVLKHDLKTVFSSVVKAMGSTLGACGDVNRNVMAPPLVDGRVDPSTGESVDVIGAHCVKVSNDIADLLAPQSGAYYDVWLDGEKFMSMERESPEVTKVRTDASTGASFAADPVTGVPAPEPVYGGQFLPRKFKVAVTRPGDNHVDLFTNDLGVVVLPSADGKSVAGYDIVVGGGLGRTHRNASTFPRLAEPLGSVTTYEEMLSAVKAVVATQRDYGRRDDRRQARLKYLVSEWGIDRFRTVCETYHGKPLEPFVPLPAWEYKSYLGWHAPGASVDGAAAGAADAAEDGWAYGVYVQNGRVQGEGKKALRSLIESLDLGVTITANQNIILHGIRAADRTRVETELAAAGLPGVDGWDPIEAGSMACPALPLCGLAVAEAERGLPEINARIRKLLAACGVAADGPDARPPPVVRMTGCPNGCARPYMAELGFVGDGPNSYQLYLGGCPNQTRLSELYAERVRASDATLERTLEPIFAAWARRGRAGEALGDFCARTGLDALRAEAEARTEWITAAPAERPRGKPAAARGSGASTSGGAAGGGAAVAERAPAKAAGAEASSADLLAQLGARAASEGKSLEEYLGSVLRGELEKGKK